MTGLETAHQGYEYQDLLTAYRLVDMLLGSVIHTHVDKKLVDNDRFDDLTTEDISGNRERIQFKYTDNNDRPLTLSTFTTINRSLRLDHVIASMLADRTVFANKANRTIYRIILRDQAPNENELKAVLTPIKKDPGPFIPTMQTQRFGFDTMALWDQRQCDSNAKNIFNFLFSNDTPLAYDDLKWACEHLVVEVGAPPMSRDLTSPELAEQLLLSRVRSEVGAESFPNTDRSAVDVASAIITTARVSRQSKSSPTAIELLRRANLKSDFGAVLHAHPVDKKIQVLRPVAVQQLIEAATELASTGGYLIVKGPPGHGKSWICHQLLDTLSSKGWLKAEHYCYLGDADGERLERVLEEHVYGSLVGRLAEADPRLVLNNRPRFAADEETLVGCLQRSLEQEPNRRIALVIDGIDHITRIRGCRNETYDPSRRLTESLAYLDLPPGTVVIVLSQPGPHLAPLENIGSKSITIPDLDDEELRSLAERLNVIPNKDHEQVINEPPLIQETEAIAEFLNAITDRSARNALYATYICREILRCGDTLIDPGIVIRNLPAFDGTLKNYYDHLYMSLGSEAEWVADIIALIDFSVTRTELCEIRPDTAHHVDKALTVLEPVLIERATQGGVRIYHESFSRYLRDGFERNQSVVIALLDHIAIWLKKKGIFNDSRAFRSLLKILAEAGYDQQVVDTVDLEFVDRAISAFFPVSWINANLALAIGSAARLNDWPLILRYVELSRAADSYQSERFDTTLVAFADIPAMLIGIDKLATRLVDDDRIVIPARAGLQMCAAVDKLGAIAPWRSYMDGFLRESELDNTVYGKESDLAVELAWLRGRLRLASIYTDSTFKESTYSSDRTDSEPRKKLDYSQIDWTKLAHWIEERNFPANDVLKAVEDTFGANGVHRLINCLERPSDMYLAIAETSPENKNYMGSSQFWAKKVVTQGIPTGLAYKLVRLGLNPMDLIHESIEAARKRLLELTGLIQEPSIRWEGEPLKEWLDACTFAAYRDPLGLNAAESFINGEGWYRCWLRFAIGLSRAEAAAPTSQGLIALGALSLLIGDLNPFSGEPRACDLYSLHDIIQNTINRAINMLDDDQWIKGLDILKEVSSSITTMLSGEICGPVPPDYLLKITVNGANPTKMNVAKAFLEDIITTRSARRFYTEIAEYRLYAARLAIAGGDLQQAQSLWMEACKFLTAYGWHKDITIYEILDPFSILIKTYPARARARITALQNICERVPLHTDGKETRHAWSRWWELLTEADPVGTVRLAVPQLLSKCNDPNMILNSVLEGVWDKWNNQADPFISGALRLILNMPLDSADFKQIERLTIKPNDIDPIVRQLMTWLLARVDERPLEYSYSNSIELVAQDDEEVLKLNDLAYELNLPLVRKICEDTEFSTQSSPRWIPQKPLPSFISMIDEIENIAFPSGLPGLTRAIRAWRLQSYDLQVSEYMIERFANIIGYRLIELASEGMYQEASSMIRVLAESSTFRERSGILRSLSEGLDRHGEIQLAAMAYTLTWINTRSHGGWLTFGGKTEIDALKRATLLDTKITRTVIADEIVKIVATSRYGTYGITQAIIYAFCTGALTCPGKSSIDVAFEVWDEAFAVIDKRAPIVAETDNPDVVYHPPIPDNNQPIIGDLDTALALATLGGLAHPGRENKRRTLLAAQLLLNERAEIVAPAFDITLSAISDPATLTWLLWLITSSDKKSLPVHMACQATLRNLVSSNLVTIRALARRLLIGNKPSLPPSNPSHYGLLNQNNNILWIPSNESREITDPSADIKKYIESIAGKRLEQGKKFLPGLKHAVCIYAATLRNDEIMQERFKEQLRNFDRLNKHSPDAFLVPEEFIEKALQTIAASGRAAYFMEGEPISNPVEWEDELASTLLNDPSVPLALEACRRPRPHLIPPPGFRSEVWGHIRDHINSGSSSFVEEISCDDSLVFATIAIEPANSTPLVESGTFKDWRWLATVEKRIIKPPNEISSSESSLFTKRYRALEVRDLNDRQALTYPPVTSGDLRMWEVNINPASQALLFNKSQPLVGEDIELKVIGDGHNGLGVSSTILVPSASMVALLKLRSGKPYCYQDEDGPALVLVTWRAEYDISEYCLAWPRICGSGIMIRPDLLDKIIDAVGEYRLVLRDFIIGDSKLVN